MIGLVDACNNNPKTAGTDSLVVKARAFPVFCPEYDEKALQKMIDDIYLEKNSVASDCAVCAAPCGNTSDYDMRRIYEADEADLLGLLNQAENMEQDKSPMFHSLANGPVRSGSPR